MTKQYLTFLFFLVLVCGCEKIEMPSCSQDTATVCIVNTRNTAVYGSFSANSINDTLTPNQRRCYNIKVSEFITFKLASGTRYSWQLKHCEEEYPLF